MIMLAANLNVHGGARRLCSPMTSAFSNAQRVRVFLANTNPQVCIPAASHGIKNAKHESLIFI